jgi:hypothetical protein
MDVKKSCINPKPGGFLQFQDGMNLAFSGVASSAATANEENP